VGISPIGYEQHLRICYGATGDGKHLGGVVARYVGARRYGALGLMLRTALATISKVPALAVILRHCGRDAWTEAFQEEFCASIAHFTLFFSGFFLGLHGYAVGAGWLAPEDSGLAS